MRALVDHVTPAAALSRAHDDDLHRRDHLLAKEVAAASGPAIAQARSAAGCSVNDRESPWVTPPYGHVGGTASVSRRRVITDT